MTPVSYPKSFGQLGATLVLLLAAIVASLFAHVPLTAHSYVQSTPQASANKKAWQLAFERNMIFPRFVLDGATPTNIFVVKADGNDAELQLTRDGRSSYPLWLSDGQNVVFVHSPKGTPSQKRSVWASSEIVVMSTDGGNPKQIASFRLGQTMSLSPDGRTLALDGAEDGTPITFESSIYLLDVVAGGKPRLLVKGGSSPSWSPDGSRIVYSCDHLLKSGKATRSVCVVPVAEASEPHLLAVNAWKPSWSPAGESIVYISLTAANPQLILCEADGSGAVPLTDGQHKVLSAAWSPDGKRVAFTEIRPMEDEVFHSGPLAVQQMPRIFLTSLDGETTGPLGGSMRLWCDQGISWSPDGHVIGAICASGLRDPATRKQIFAMSLYLIDATDLKSEPRFVAAGVMRAAFPPMSSNK